MIMILSEVVCKRDWHNMSSYLFFMWENVGLSLQWPLVKE